MTFFLIRRLYQLVCDFLRILFFSGYFNEYFTTTTHNYNLCVIAVNLLLYIIAFQRGEKLSNLLVFLTSSKFYHFTPNCLAFVIISSEAHSLQIFKSVVSVFFFFFNVSPELNDLCVASF